MAQGAHKQNNSILLLRPVNSQLRALARATPSVPPLPEKHPAGDHASDRRAL